MISLPVYLIPNHVLHFCLGVVFCNGTVLIFHLDRSDATPLSFAKGPVQSSPEGSVAFTFYDLEYAAFCFFVLLVSGCMEAVGEMCSSVSLSILREVIAPLFAF
jgi:hypothetical protein